VGGRGVGVSEFATVGVKVAIGENVAVGVLGMGVNVSVGVAVCVAVAVRVGGGGGGGWRMMNHQAHRIHKAIRTRAAIHIEGGLICLCLRVIHSPIYKSTSPQRAHLCK
jgi:hypothetical protein